jgi:hypothetical protein
MLISFIIVLSLGEMSLLTKSCGLGVIRQMAQAIDTAAAAAAAAAQEQATASTADTTSPTTAVESSSTTVAEAATAPAAATAPTADATTAPTTDSDVATPGKAYVHLYDIAAEGMAAELSEEEKVVADCLIKGFRGIIDSSLCWDLCRCVYRM